MVFKNELSESLVTNLLKDIELIDIRTKNIKNTLRSTKNNNLKARLKKEYILLLNKLESIQKTSIDIYKSSQDEISLSALLIEKGNRIKFKTHNNIELFFS